MEVAARRIDPMTPAFLAEAGWNEERHILELGIIVSGGFL
jgi:hypothetical protein